MDTLRPVAALFVARNSVYKTLPGVISYDEDRDALTFTERIPVVAHPPCRLFSRMRRFSTADPGEKVLAHVAVNLIRGYGGVLEHPFPSLLWEEMAMPMPGEGKDFYGGFIVKVDQRHWGHPAQKATLLYIVGTEPRLLPLWPLSLRPPQAVVSATSRSRKKKVRECRKNERQATPLAFAQWLVEIARSTIMD